MAEIVKTLVDALRSYEQFGRLTPEVQESLNELLESETPEDPESPDNPESETPNVPELKVSSTAKSGSSLKGKN